MASARGSEELGGPVRERLAPSHLHFVMRRWGMAVSCAADPIRRAGMVLAADAKIPGRGPPLGVRRLRISVRINLQPLQGTAATRFNLLGNGGSRQGRSVPVKVVQVSRTCALQEPARLPAERCRRVERPDIPPARDIQCRRPGTISGVATGNSRKTLPQLRTDRSSDHDVTLGGDHPRSTPFRYPGACASPPATLPSIPAR